MVFLLGIVGWFIVDLVIEIVGEGLLELTRALNEEVGAVMEAWGRLRSSREHRISHLATWYGGASMGLGLAAGRLGLLLLIKGL